MKKRVIRISCILIIMLFSVMYILGEKQFSLELNEVSMIEIFNGQTGNNIIIQDEEEIKKIVNNLNEVSMKCQEISFLKSGYALRFSIYNSGGKKIESFVINSKNSIRRTFFSYQVIKGELNYKYFYNLVEKK